MDRLQLLKLTQRYLVNISLGNSSLRNQGAAGVLDAARRFLASLDLSPLVNLMPPEYRKWLDEITESLRESLPEGARNWGTARKAVNIFMVQALLNRTLCAEYRLDRFEREMETPLDSMAIKGLKSEAGRGRLPRWPRVCRLTPAISDHYQDFALQLAEQHGIPRPCLDMILWRPE